MESVSWVRCASGNVYFGAPLNSVLDPEKCVRQWEVCYPGWWIQKAEGGITLKTLLFVCTSFKSLVWQSLSIFPSYMSPARGRKWKWSNGAEKFSDSVLLQCTMWLSIALGNFKIFKSNWLTFTHFWSKSDEILNILQEKYFSVNMIQIDDIKK